MNRRRAGSLLLRPFFRWFDRVFFRVRDVYVRLVGHSLNKNVRYVFLYVLIVAAMGFLFLQLRTSYLPDEDQGVLLCQVTLPVGSTLEQTEAVMEKVRDQFLNKEKDAVDSIMTISGQNQSGRGQNIGYGLCQAQGLETAHPAGAEGYRRGQQGHAGVFTDPQRHGVRLPAAAGHRTGQCQGY